MVRYHRISPNATAPPPLPHHQTGSLKTDIEAEAGAAAMEQFHHLSASAVGGLSAAKHLCDERYGRNTEALLTAFRGGNQHRALCACEKKESTAASRVCGLDIKGSTKKEGQIV